MILTYHSQVGENAGGLDDSMFSTQSDSRRSTLYKRPGKLTSLHIDLI